MVCMLFGELSMSQNHVIELPNTPKQRPIVCDYAGGRFRLTAEGLTFIGIDKDGICSMT